MSKPLNLSAKLYVRGGEAKFLTVTPDGKLIFQTDKGKVLVTDNAGTVDGKQKVFDAPQAKNTGKFVPGETAYYLRFGAKWNHFVPCRYLAMSDKQGVAFVELLTDAVNLRGKADGRPRAVLAHLYKSPEEAEAKVLAVLESVRAYTQKSKPSGVITRKAEQRA